MQLAAALPRWERVFRSYAASFCLMLSLLFFSVRVRVGRLQRSRPVAAKPKIVRGTRGTSFLSARASTFSFGLEQLHVILWALDTP